MALSRSLSGLLTDSNLACRATQVVVQVEASRLQLFSLLLQMLDSMHGYCF